VTDGIRILIRPEGVLAWDAAHSYAQYGLLQHPRRALEFQCLSNKPYHPGDTRAVRLRVNHHLDFPLLRVLHAHRLIRRPRGLVECLADRRIERGLRELLCAKARSLPVRDGNDDGCAVHAFLRRRTRGRLLGQGGGAPE
jgi:hypothetical protein